MKKIFGNIRTLAALLIASATLAACSTEDSVMTGEKAPQVYTLTIDASMDGGAQTRALEFEGTKLVAKWANGETVDVRRGGTPLGTLTVSNVSADGQTCTLSGTLTGTIDKYDVLRFHYNYSGTLVNESQTGTLSSTAASDYAMATVTVKSVDGGNITLDPEPNFQTQVAVLKITMQDALANKLNATSLKIKIGDKDLCTLSPSATAYSENGDGVVYFALPSAHRVYTEGISSIGLDEDQLAAATVTFTATVGGNTYIATKTGYPFVAGKYYATTLTMAKQAAAPAGAEAVDLGLPSGTLWANMNVGATSESDYGDYFAWGETEPYYSSQDPLTWKDGKTNGYADDWSSYKFGSSGSFTKYTGSDSKPKLEAADDAATQNWGGDWRMPTYTELNELADTYNTDANDNSKTHLWEWKENYNGSGHNGWLITCKANNNSLFLPAAGYRDGTSLNSQGSGGFYWSSALEEGGPDYADNASYLYFGSDNAYVGTYDRYYGYPVRPVQGAAAPAGALSGVFSVSDTKQVYFSKGNLQYDGTNWKFAEHQYDYIETATGYPMDHFTWGNTSNSTAWNGTSYYTANANLSGSTDWGSNAISNGGNTANSGWYTLSSAEWTYLFNTRTNAASKFGYATVAGKEGIIIVPDDFTDPNKNKGSSAFVGSTTTGFGANVYTEGDNWNAMQSAGCVFLPAAGYRYGTSVGYVEYGYYWSSTANGAGYAYYAGFSSDNVYPASNNYRDNGILVRLVKDAN